MRHLEQLQTLILEEQHKMMKTIVTAMAENEDEAETIIEFRSKLSTKLESFSQLCNAKYSELGGEIEKAIGDYISQLPDENDTSEKLH